MKMSRLKAVSVAAVLAAVVLTMGTAAQAASIFVTPGDYTGSRSASNGITANHSWASGEDDLTLSWDISESGGVFTYIYTIANADGSPLSKGVSHTIFETSPKFGKSDILDGSSGGIKGPDTYSDAEGSSNPNIPGEIFGIKFDFGSTETTYTLVTTRRPIWGDFYLKGGRDGGTGRPTASDFLYAHNVGFGTDPTALTTDFTNWIATPDTATTTTVVPTPAAAGAGLVLLGGLFVAQRRRRSQMS